MDNRAIGYLDSGIGGLSVVKQALKDLPNEQVYYIGDTARMPYGTRQPEEVKKLTWQLVNFLMSKDIKLLVIACNTATAAALDDLTQKLTIPVIGVIQPGVDAASQATTTNKIGVIATQGTVNSLAYYQGIKKINSHYQVLQLAAPTLVKLAENPVADEQLMQQTVTQILKPIKNSDIDTLVLGCTHFPLLSHYIQQALASNIKIIDAGASAVTVVKHTLNEMHLNHEITTAPSKKNDEYFTTGNSDIFNELAQSWLGVSNLNVKHLNIKDNQLVNESE